jgi:hypothetical protein
MKRRFPLYAKILVWFFLNLVLLGIVTIAVLGGRVGINLLLAGHVGERVRGVNGVIRAELRQRPSSEWTEVLQRHSEAYRVKFLLFRIDGTQLAGEPNRPCDVSSRPLLIARAASESSALQRKRLVAGES